MKSEPGNPAPYVPMSKKCSQRVRLEEGGKEFGDFFFPLVDQQDREMSAS